MLPKPSQSVRNEPDRRLSIRKYLLGIVAYTRQSTGNFNLILKQSVNEEIPVIMLNTPGFASTKIQSTLSDIRRTESLHCLI